MKRIYTFLLAVIFLTAGAGSVFGFDSTSSSFQIQAADIENASGASSSSSYTNQDALGQTGSGFSTSTSFNDYAGILYWLFPPSGTPAMNQLNFRWRKDNGSETSATYVVATDTAVTTGFVAGDRIRLRFLLSNTGDGPATNYNYRIEYASSATSCSVWTAVPTTATTEHWAMGGQSNVADNISTTDSAGISNPGGKTFHAGKLRTISNSTGGITITQSQFSEIEYSIKSNTNTTVSIPYCFRVTNAGSTTNFTYTATPQITISSLAANTLAGGAGGSQSSATPSAPVGGGAPGGGTVFAQCSDGIDNDGDTLVDAADPGCHIGGNINNTYVPTNDSEVIPPQAPSGGGGPGGGGGDSGFLFGQNNLASAGGSGISTIDILKILLFGFNW